MKEAPIILHIDLKDNSLYKWLEKNRYIVFSELIRYCEKIITEDIESVQAVMISNSYDNIVFIVKKQNVELTLNRAMEYFLEIEEYEKCSEIRDLLSKL